MDDLRELNARAALLLGWERREVTREEYYKLPRTGGTIYCEVVWIKPNGTVYTAPPHFSSHPAACAELDGEMQQKGFWGALLRLDDACLAVYFTPGQYGLKGLMALLNKNGSRGATECEARTWAAVRALEGEGEAK